MQERNIAIALGVVKIHSVVSNVHTRGGLMYNILLSEPKERTCIAV